MAAVTNIDQVVDALLALFTTATGLQVEDGPSVGEVAPAAIVVGMPSSGNEPGYTTEVAEQSGMGRPRYEETCTVRSMLTISTGNTDAKEVRDTCAGHLRAIDTALRVAHTGAVWDRARLGRQMEWVVIQHEDGVTCTVFFAVEAVKIL
jgi:hypothetical protein